MSGSVTTLWRHPIKAHGREALEQVSLIPGHCMPGDRVWAVAHEASKADGTGWASCGNFTRAAGSPQLMAITARTMGNEIALMHPQRPDFRFDPETDQDGFIDWVTPLMPEGRAAPVRLVSAPGVGFTDSPWQSITLCNMASHRAVEQKLGRDLSIHRWRGNIWFDGFPVWEEFDWIDRTLRIGDAVLKVRDRTTRCKATTANPETGLRDADLLGALEMWGHQDFSVQAEVIEGGLIQTGDKVELI